MNIVHAEPVLRPAGEDARACEQWLARAALADTRQACASFVGLLDEIEDAPPAPGAYVEILERLRRPMRSALDDQMQRLSTRPLPLAGAEETAFMQARDLWLSLLRAWQRLQQAAERREADLAHARALIALRVIESAAGLIAVHFAARREVDTGFWHWLHQGYLQAERQHVAETDVAGAGAELTSCAAAYSEVLLLSLAHPYGLGARELAWTRSWTRRWARKAKLWRSAENGGGPAVDLEGDAAPQWTAAGVPGAGIRFIDCVEVGRSIRRRLRKLEQGSSPAELGLGQDCTRPAVDHLLGALARSWSDAQQVRRFPRRAASSRADVAVGMETLYELIANRQFRENGESPWSYSRRAADQFHIFQRALDRERHGAFQAQSENWETIDESADGFQLMRTASGTRIALRQLVALRPEGAPNFLLCEVRWAKQSANSAVRVGVRALPGLPKACALQTSGGGRPPGWIPAFLLPLGANVAPTLAVPAGVYCNGREAQLKVDGEMSTIRFNGLLRHGYDFDWVDFTS